MSEVSYRLLRCRRCGRLFYFVDLTGEGLTEDDLVCGCGEGNGKATDEVDRIEEQYESGQ